MLFNSTRNGDATITPLKGVLKGIAQDGGLFIPQHFPRLTREAVLRMEDMDYPQIAAEILSLYIDMDRAELLELTRAAYGGFDDKRVVPLEKLTDHEYVLELWHGPTLAFKDMALQILPRLMSEALKREPDGKKVLILTATSGDTGKAALEGFKDVEDTAIIVFYPDEGVSDMQRLQMVTQRGDNTFVCAVKGNFDDAQTGVKRMFGSESFNALVKSKGYDLSSANSINLGRLVPQIVYYVYSYVELLRRGVIKYGDPINVTVPTGNFGNILAAYYAKRMGLPVKKLICASNTNNVLTDFFHTGEYSAKRTFYKTISPSMDILISSNLERLLYEISGRDAQATAAWMKALLEKGTYDIAPAMLAELKRDFYADYCDDAYTKDTIRRVFRQNGYLMDTHTAVGQTVYEAYAARTGDTAVTVLASTASPFKFGQDVLNAINPALDIPEPFEAAKKLSQLAGKPVPRQIGELKTLPIRFEDSVEKTELDRTVLQFI